MKYVKYVNETPDLQKIELEESWEWPTLEKWYMCDGINSKKNSSEAFKTALEHQV